MSLIQVKNGETCLFRKDTWRAQILQLEFPECYSFAKNKDISVSKAMSSADVTNLFNLLVSQIVFDQMQQIQLMMEATHMQNDNDCWTYSGGSAKFSSSRIYKTMIGHRQPDSTIRWLWKSFCQPKHKVFC